MDFYKYALVGMTLEWIRRDMKTDPAAMTERLGTMIHGDLRRALCRLASNRGGTARDEDDAPEPAETVKILSNSAL